MFVVFFDLIIEYIQMKAIFAYLRYTAYSKIYSYQIRIWDSSHVAFTELPHYKVAIWRSCPKKRETRTSQESPVIANLFGEIKNIAFRASVSCVDFLYFARWMWIKFFLSQLNQKRSSIIEEGLNSLMMFGIHHDRENNLDLNPAVNRLKLGFLNK